MNRKPSVAKRVGEPLHDPLVMTTTRCWQDFDNIKQELIGEPTFDCLVQVYEPKENREVQLLFHDPQKLADMIRMLTNELQYFCSSIAEGQMLGPRELTFEEYGGEEKERPRPLNVEGILGITDEDIEKEFGDSNGS